MSAKYHGQFFFDLPHRLKYIKNNPFPYTRQKKLTVTFFYSILESDIKNNHFY